MKTIKIIRLVEKLRIPLNLKHFLLHKLYVKYGNELEEKAHKIKAEIGEYILSCMK